MTAPSRAAGLPDTTVAAGFRHLYGDHMRSANVPQDDVITTNAALIRQAYKQYAHGVLAAMLDLVDEDLEWTYLDPSESDPEPQVCHGRHEFERALERRRAQGLRSELEEVIERGDHVVVVTHTPGLDAFRERQADDRNIDVLTFRAGHIVALRACRNRAEAMALVTAE
jgi:ketosteroid isomerase-like protein